MIVALQLPTVYVNEQKLINKKELTAVEELLHYVHTNQISEIEAIKLLNQWFPDMKVQFE